MSLQDLGHMLNEFQDILSEIFIRFFCIKKLEKKM